MQVSDIFCRESVFDRVYSDYHMFCNIWIYSYRHRYKKTHKQNEQNILCLISGVLYFDMLLLFTRFVMQLTDTHMHPNAFENIACEMGAILSRGRWVHQSLCSALCMLLPLIIIIMRICSLAMSTYCERFTRRP